MPGKSKLPFNSLTKFEIKPLVLELFESQCQNMLNFDIDLLDLQCSHIPPTGGGLPLGNTGCKKSMLCQHWHHITRRGPGNGGGINAAH